MSAIVVLPIQKLIFEKSWFRFERAVENASFYFSVLHFDDFLTTLPKSYEKTTRFYNGYQKFSYISTPSQKVEN